MRTLALCALLVACAAPTHNAVAPGPAPGPSPAAPTAAAASPDAGVPGLRLPGDVVPVSYGLELTLLPELSTAQGEVVIQANVTRPTQVIWLNAQGLQVPSASIDGHAVRVVNDGVDHLGLIAQQALPVGHVTISVKFTAPIDHEKSRGLYAEKEGADTSLYTFFEPIDARRAFPCFDEPGFKTPWQLTFHVKEGHVALGNAPVLKETKEPDGMKKVELVPSKPMPSYLVAFVVGPFEVIDGGTAGRAKTPVRFVVPKGRAAELAYARSITPKVVTALEDYFDMPYPWVKLDVAVVPRYWGTMEHPGLVAMGQTLSLIRPDQATRRRKEGYTNILAHELAHYWFGDYVTLAWWDDIWLNEALGEWLDLPITDAAEPSWHVLDQRVGRATAAMTFDEALSTKAIRQPVTTRAEVEACFDGYITYLKGSTVLRMFEHAVGVEKWRDFMRSHVRAHAWGNATSEDLFSAARAQLGPEVERGLRSFLEQPGLPLISARLSCAGAPKLALHQQRSLPAGVTDPVARTWTVPVCVRFGDQKTSHRACTFLSAADGELTLEGACPTWWLLDADATGYYRSAVDAAQAQELLAPGSALARAAKPTTPEKLMLVEDLRAAIDRGELTVDKALTLAPLLVNDPEDRVAAAAFSAAAFSAHGLDDALYAKYLAFTVATFKPLARKLGWKRGPTDSDDRHLLRQRALGIADDDAELSAEARALATAWLRSRSVLEDDLVSTMLSAATRHGDAALFDALLAAARTAGDRREKSRLLTALGGFSEPKLVQRALALPLGAEFDLRDSLNIVSGVLARRETRAAALTFVEAHADELLARMRDDEASWFLEELATSACDQATVERVAAIVEPRAKQHGAAAASVARGLELSRQCIDNTRRQLPALKAFLK